MSSRVASPHRSWARRFRRRPGLSVVVPAYAVEAYLAACLDSILDQTYRDLEVIVVLDGAVDRSPEIAHDYARRDPRIRLVEQENTGLSRARNAGARRARGDYLTFVDADDVLPRSAYAHLMGSARRTGSDIVIGNLERVRGERRRTMPLMRRNHRHHRERITVTDQPLLLAEVFAVNKVIRRDFWEAQSLEFPEGLRYEDQPVLTRALLAAASIDVLTETVYLWQERADGSSITQGRHQLDDLAHRAASKRVSTQLVLESGDTTLLDTWYREVMPVDMWEYFRASAHASDEYWALLQSVLRELWNEETVRFEDTAAPAQQRLMGWLVEHGRREQLVELVAWLDSRSGPIPVEERHGRRFALLPGVDDPDWDVPESVYVVAEPGSR